MASTRPSFIAGKYSAASDAVTATQERNVAAGARVLSE
jgi:hypothetical protein